MNTQLWSPDDARRRDSHMAAFMRWLGDHAGEAFDTYDALHHFSLVEPEVFWNALWLYCGIIGDRGSGRMENPHSMPGASYFVDAQLNFAENLLRRDDDHEALVFWGEDTDRRRLSWRELSALVSQLQQAFVAQGVSSGDRIAAMLPNCPEAVAAMLAAASIGAIWSSCSPDFGPQGALDRFCQIEPKLFIAADGYVYNGKVIDIASKVEKIVAQLPEVRQVIIVDYLGCAQQTAQGFKNAIPLSDIVRDMAPAPVAFTRLPFDHPLYILFSSGTTGVPKCIVHSAGGILVQHLKEHQLHCNIRAKDRVFYFTTCGWMMWNWLVSALASQATLLLYDGSPFYPDGNILFDYADAEAMSFFGTSAKYIDALRKAELAPVNSHSLSTVRTIASTGSPLAPESFDYVYQSIKGDVHLASVSGGTDICACFVGGNPMAAVIRGEIQVPILGMATQVWDETGRPLGPGEGKGELVCAKPFPSMPVAFWDDSDGQKYHNAYFAKYNNIWCHGDYAEWTENGGMIIHGRSDATLNPGGVRIGTAEIYAQVEKIPQVLESLAVGQEWDDDTRIVLFVRLAHGVELDDTLTQAIRSQVRAGASPRHVPAKVIAIADIPRTKSGKITELAVRDVIHGREIKNKEALANPEALALFENLAALQS